MCICVYSSVPALLLTFNASGFLGSSHSQRVRVDFVFACFFDAGVFRPTRAGCTIGHSKAGAAATPLPRGQTEPTKAADLDIFNDNEYHSDDDNDDDNDNHKKAKHLQNQNVEIKKKTVFTLGVVGREA